MTRRQMLTALFGAAACGTAGGGLRPSAGAGRAGPELILRYAENQPEDYPTTQAALAFADLVAERTDGRVKVLVYSGGELGAEQSVIQQMQFGGIDFSRVSLSQLAEYQPALSVLQLPYLYTDADQMWRVLDGTIGDEFLSTLESLELTGLSWFDAGVRSIYTRREGDRPCRSAGPDHPRAGIGHDERNDHRPRRKAGKGSVQQGVCRPAQR